MANLQDARLQQIASQFEENAYTGVPEDFDHWYNWLSDQLPEFAEFEQVCMALGLA